jgi:hypothetical protein
LGGLLFNRRDWPELQPSSTPQLKALGLIDDELVPTDLVHDFRDDDKYADACDAMIARVYPSGLTDAVQDPSQEMDAAIRWFMRQGAGEATAKLQARFYALLVSRQVPETSEKPKRQAQSTKAASPAGGAKKSSTAAETGKATQTGTAEPKKLPAGDGRQMPTVHVDLQIHISPDSPPEQVDAIFASISKHLYGR